jgi:hypothetical protein
VFRAFKPDAPGLPDSLLLHVRAPALLALALIVPPALHAQGDTTFTAWLRFRDVPPLVVTTPAILRSPWAGGPRLSGAQAGEAWDSALAVRVDSLRVARVTTWRLRQIYGRGAAVAEDSTTERRGLLGVSRRYADLSIDGNARVEIQTERLKNLRCTALDYLDVNSGCRGGFKPPRLDTYLAVRSGGLIGQRLHVDIDYDTERDFSASNNVQLYYQGLEDEVVRRVEVGTVTYRPPATRFLTAAIPANNFGVNATFQVGPVTLQGIAATQKGSVVAERTYTIGATTVQPQDRQVRDLDYESGRFFWVVDPRTLPGYPAIDILNVNAQTLPSSAVIESEVRVYRYRPASSNGINPNLGGINAVGISTDSSTIRAQWQLLQRGIDYYIDPSGTWFALAARLDPKDYLAVSYRSQAGPVGTYPAVDAGATSPPRDTLRLIVEPQVAAARATFQYEMRQVYRVAGADLDPGSLKVTLSLSRSEAPLRPGALPTYLAELGLATTSDPNSFNVQERLFPRSRDPNAAVTFRESYIVFPALQPFADPAHLLATERNDSLYRTPYYLLLSEGPPAKFLFRLRYNATSSGDRSSLDLGALQIRDGSETLFLNGRRLDQGTDYTINYDLGQVTFLNPQALFGNSTATVQARFEERGIFAVAPTQIYGFATRYSLGETGGVNLLGMYQVEQSAFNRPQLGFEAQAHMVGGVSTDLRFKPEAVTRFLNHLTSTPAPAGSRLDINAEVALTRPDPNRSGQAYLEEFEGDPGVPVSLRESLWGAGSRPEFADGVESVVGVFDTADAVQLTWQNLALDRATGQAYQIRARDIDDRIQVVGQQDQLETVLFMALHADTAGGQPDRNSFLHWKLPRRPGRPRWRSMVTSLSPTGVDLSKNEYLEFWVFHDNKQSVDSAGAELMVDLGTVSEDAIAIAPESLSTATGDSVFTGRQFVGLGRLDTEREPTGVFNAATDDNGILGDRPDALVVNNARVEEPALCRQTLSNVVPLYDWGDLGARCSNGNGVLDTEDLDGDNQLDASGGGESSFRWVVDLSSTLGPYFVRNGVQGTDGSGWRLYRIPLRTPEHTLGSPNIRLVKHLRITVVAPPTAGSADRTAFFAMARMRLLGAPWIRRSDRPVSSIAGATSGFSGEVVSTTVSTENQELGYVSPPGVVTGVSTKGGTASDLGTQINERSLRIIGRGIDIGQRAEAYLRFPSGPQNLLKYGELRAWVRGRGPGWDDHDFRAYVRVGSDSRNFYQYSAFASTTTWEPEMRISLDHWRSLRAQIESRRLQGQPADSAVRVACGGDTVSVAYVVCDGPYLVHVEDPAVNPPNLAQVQEVAAGIYRVGLGDPTPDAELWVDDIRLAEPISKVGSAVAIDARLVASDVGDLSFGYVRQDGYFQQIGQDPSYRTTGAMQFGSNTRLDRFLPAGLGIVVPFSVTYARTTVDPQLLTGTDLQGSDLVGLRRPENWALSYSFSVNRSQRGRSWLVRSLVDPLAVSGSFSSGNSVTELSKATSSGRALQASYTLQQSRHGVSLNLGGLVDALPRFLRKSDAADGLRRPFLNLAPSSIRLNSGVTRSESDLLAYQVPVFQAADSALRPVVALTSLWRNSAGLTWQPLGMVSLSGDLASTRDLRRYDDSTTLGRLATQARRSLLGLDVGVERDRQLNTSFQLAPRLVSWLRPRYATGSAFILSRSLTTRSPVRLEGDTAGGFILPQTLNNSRFREYGASVDIARLAVRLFGDSSTFGRATRRVRAFDISDRLTHTSTFDLAAFDPSLGYQLGLGGLQDFLVQHGDSALGASQERNTSITSGADLPLGLTFALSYGRIRTTRFQRAAGAFLTSETVTREWPKGGIRLTHTFRNSPIAVLGIGTTFRTARGVTVIPSTSGPNASSSTYSSNWTPDVSATLRNGMAFSGSYSVVAQENLSNGNLTRLDQNTLTAAVNHAFTLPKAFGRAKRVVRSQLSAVLANSTSCLRRGSDSDCTGVSDTRRQEYRATFDADLAKIMTGGLQFSYSINEARQLDQKYSQIIISASFQLSLFAGDYR